MRGIWGVIVALAFGGGALLHGGTATFQGLGDLPGGGVASLPAAISGDGSVVVGLSSSGNGQEGFVWTSDGGMVGLGTLPGGPGFASVARGVSSDGRVVVGDSSSAKGTPQAFRWTSSGGMSGLGDLEGGVFDSIAFAANADGSVIVGDGQSDSGQEAFRWTGLMPVGLGDLPGGNFDSGAIDVNADGSVVVGFSSSQGPGLGWEAFRWTAAGGMMVGLGDLPGGQFQSIATGVSDDGSVVVGDGSTTAGQEPFRWTASGGMIGLGNLPGQSFGFGRDLSADGSVVVGGSGADPFIWDTTHGMRNLTDVLVDDCGLDLGGWTLLDARAVSDDGLTITGAGVNPDGNSEGWIATLSPQCADLPLIGDIDGDGIVGINDFLSLLGNWGPCPEPCPPSCPADLDDDCMVGITDFLILLGNWSL